jgi:serine/threonine-protein kinase
MGLEPGAIIGPNVRLGRLLAKGGMGSVWVADHLRLKTQVAVKLMAEVLSADPIIRKRFALEAEAAAQIRSPHVVQILDHGSTDEGILYIVMELLEGESLATRLQRVGRMDLGEVAAIVTQTSKALTHAHSLGFIHRDIKPDNLHLTESNGELFVKVLDFGIAKRHDRSISMTRSGAVLGTPRYMSPEQLFSAKHVTAGADLWSLAAVAYRALLGRPPFDGDSPVAMGVLFSRGTFPAPREIRPELPSELDIWFRRAFDLKRVDRFSSAREFAETFVRAARLPFGLAVPARLPPAPRSARPSDGAISTDAPTPSVLVRRECVQFVLPKASPQTPPLARGYTVNDAEGGHPEASINQRGKLIPSK